MFITGLKRARKEKKANAQSTTSAVCAVSLSLFVCSVTFGFLFSRLPRPAPVLFLSPRSSGPLPPRPSHRYHHRSVRWSSSSSSPSCNTRIASHPSIHTRPTIIIGLDAACCRPSFQEPDRSVVPLADVFFSFSSCSSLSLVSSHLTTQILRCFDKLKKKQALTTAGTRACHLLNTSQSRSS